MPKHKKGSAIKLGMEETGKEHGLGSHFFKHAEKVKHYANEYAVRAELDGISKALRHLFKDDEKLTPDQETELKAKIQAETEKRKAGIAPTTTYSTIDFTSTSTSTRRASGRPAAKGAASSANDFGLTPLANYVTPEVKTKVNKIRNYILEALTLKEKNQWVEANDQHKISETYDSLHARGIDADSGTTDYYIGDKLSNIVSMYNDAVKEISIDNTGGGPDKSERAKIEEVEMEISTSL